MKFSKISLSALVLSSGIVSDVCSAFQASPPLSLAKNEKTKTNTFLYIVENPITITTAAGSVAYTTTTASNIIPMKEIISVQIFDPKSLHPPFVSLVSDILSKDKNVELYATFEVNGEEKGASIKFDIQGGIDRAYVNLPIEARDRDLKQPVKCTIRKRRTMFAFFFKKENKALFTADLFLQNDNHDSDTGMGHVTAILRDHEGNNVGLSIKAEVFNTEWKSANLGKKEVTMEKRKSRKVNTEEKKMDWYLQLFQKLIPIQVKNMNLGGAEVLEKPTKEANKNLPTMSLLNGVFEYPKKDEFLRLPLAAKFLIPYMNKYLPNNERTTPVDQHAPAVNKVRTYLQTGVKSPYEGRWVQPLSDKSMTRVFFSSLGMPYVVKNPEIAGGGYVADLTYLGELSYKESMENLGCKVYFNSNGDVRQIKDYDGEVYCPGDAYWEWAKLKARSNVFTLASLEHVSTYHFTWACAPGTSLRMYLPPTHPIRMAFSAHFFRTHYTCAKAEHSLVSERGVLARALPFTKEGMDKAFTDLMTDMFAFETYPDELKRRGVKDCDFHIGSSDGVDLHEIMLKYACNLFDEVYETEDRFLKDEAMREVYKYLQKKIKGIPKEYSMANVKMVWGEILFRVTGMHTLIGNSAAYALDPFMVNFRMLQSEKGITKTSQECQATVTSITGITIPDNYPRLSQDWSHVLHDRRSKAYATLRKDLDKHSKAIDERNASKDRRFVNKDFHPDHVAVSTFS